MKVVTDGLPILTVDLSSGFNKVVESDVIYISMGGGAAVLDMGFGGDSKVTFGKASGLNNYIELGTGNFPNYFVRGALFGEVAFGRIDNHSEQIVGSVSAVPVPASGVLFGYGLLFLAARSQ